MEIGAKKKVLREKKTKKREIQQNIKRSHTRKKKAARQKRKKLMDVFVLFFWCVRVWKKRRKNAKE